LSFRFAFSFCFVGVRQPWKDSASVMMKRPIPLLYRGDAFSDITSPLRKTPASTYASAARGRHRVSQGTPFNDSDSFSGGSETGDDRARDLF